MEIEQLKACLLNLDEPIAKRTHAAFHLRTLGSEEAVLIIMEGIHFIYQYRSKFVSSCI
jgi:hypothetical protein